MAMPQHLERRASLPVEVSPRLGHQGLQESIREPRSLSERAQDQCKNGTLSSTRGVLPRHVLELFPQGLPVYT